MPCRVDALKSYVSGKKFAKLKANHDFNFSKLEPFLVPSKKRKYVAFVTTLTKGGEGEGHSQRRRRVHNYDRDQDGVKTIKRF